MAASGCVPLLADFAYRLGSELQSVRSVSSADLSTLTCQLSCFGQWMVEINPHYLYSGEVLGPSCVHGHAIEIQENLQAI